MQYQYAHPDSYAFLAAGSVLLSKSGSPNFSVKLGQEIFFRCRQYLDVPGRLSIYDPCCGTAYWLTCLGVLNVTHIDMIFASDINPDFLEVAQKNFQILSPQGRKARYETLEALLQHYGKSSHREALKHLDHMEAEYLQEQHSPTINLFERDIFVASQVANFQVDLILTDVPYGDLVSWQSSGGINQLLTQMIPHLYAHSVLAVVHDKYQKVNHEQYHRLEKFKLGKRVVELLRLSR